MFIEAILALVVIRKSAGNFRQVACGICRIDLYDGTWRCRLVVKLNHA